MYEPRHSIRRRALRVAQQRGWVSDNDGAGAMFGRVVLLALAAVAAVWLLFAVSGTLLGLIPTAVAGLVVGWLASKLTGARLGLGWTIVAGIAGSWLGGALFHVILPRALLAGGIFNPLGLVAGVLGASILIAFTRAMARPALPGASRPRFGRI